MSSLGRTAAAVVVVAVTVGVVASPVGTASASATVGQPVAAVDVNAERVCDELPSNGPAVTAVTPASNPMPIDTAQDYYAGTNLTVVFCAADGEPESTDTWGLNEHPGFTMVEERDRAYVINLNEQTMTIQFAEQVDQRDPDEGFSVTITAGAVVDSRLPGVAQIGFTSSETADSYNNTEQAYLNAIAEVESNITTIDRMTESYNTSNELNSTAVNKTLQTLSMALGAAHNETERIERVLYESAFDGSETTEALREVDSRSRQVNGNWSAARNELGSVLNKQIDGYRSDIKRTMLSGLAPGLVAGFLVGVGIPYWRKRKVEYDRKFTRTSGGSWVFRAPILLAVVALLVGLLTLLLSVPIRSVIA